MFAAKASAEIIGVMVHGTAAGLNMLKDENIKYSFSLYTSAALPSEFGKVNYDYRDDPARKEIHPDTVNYCCTEGNRAVCCFEPNSPYENSFFSFGEIHISFADSA